MMLRFDIVVAFTALFIWKPVSSQCEVPSSSQCSCCQVTQGPLNCISNACDLECDFDRPCRWHNGTNCLEDDFDWPIATSVPLDSWHSIPRGREGQCDPFAYTRGSFGIHKHADNRAILVSDPIKCQIGEGILKFWYWKTALYPSLRVCIRKVPGPCGILTCLATIHGLHRHEWNMRTVKIPPQTEPFEIVFEARMRHNFDIIGLDKISYSARICECGFQPQTSTNVEGILPAEGISSSSPVSTTTSTPFQTLPPSFETTTEPILPTAPSFGTSETIPTPVTSEPVTFSPATLPPPISFTQPSPATVPQPVYTVGPQVITPPLVGQPILYAPQPAAYYPQPDHYAAPAHRPHSDPASCPAVDCAFDQGSPCSYSSITSGGVTNYAPPGAVMRQWRVTNKETANSLTGIFSDSTGTGMYAYAGDTTNNLDMYLLESPRFSVNSPSLVEFSYYLAGVQGRLRGCVNGLADCRFESTGKDIKSDARRWRRGSFQLEPGSYTIHFVGDNLGKNYVIGLDDVQLKTVTGSRLQCAVY